MQNVKRVNLSRIVRAALFAAVTAILAQLAIPMPSGVPVTLQTFAVALTGYILGGYTGAVSIGVYIALGAVGLPVFASMRGGAAVITGATGGFIVGFLPMAMLCGLALKFRNAPAKIALSSAGLLCCHVTGVLWYAVVAGNAVIPSFLLISAPYLLKDAVSVALAYIAATQIRKRIAI